MIDYILQFKFNSLLGLILYWLPLAFCLLGFSVRTAQNYVKDRKCRETPGAHYVPTDTIGSLIGRAFATVIPVVNIWAATIDIAPAWIRTAVDWLTSTFDQALVPDSEAAKAGRRNIVLKGTEADR